MNADVRTMLLITLAAFIPPLVILWFLGIGGYAVFLPLDGGGYLAIGLFGVALLSMAYIAVYLYSLSQIDDDLREINIAVKTAVPKPVYFLFQSVAILILSFIFILGSWFVYLGYANSRAFSIAWMGATLVFFSVLLLWLNDKRKAQSPK